MSQRVAVLLVISSALSVLGAVTAGAQTFNSGSTGADGAFNPTANTTLALPPTGVFNFTTVNIPANVTVKFTKNAANTPVTILASGNITIAGTIDVSGSPGLATSGIAAGTTGGAGGPGGFDGGNGANGISTTGGTGRGPGGGKGGTGPTGGGGGGGNGENGENGQNGAAGSGSTAGVGGQWYGDSTLLPLVGGSGGGGGGSNFGVTGGGGGGGGGALLIASAGTITLPQNGRILANGGGGICSGNTACGAGGSGGSVRLVATTVTGSGGTINMSGGTYAQYLPSYGGWGAAGRLRIEGFTNTLSASMPGAQPWCFSTGAPTSVTLPNTPTLQITAIAGVAVPANASGTFFAPDVVLPGNTTNPVTVNLAASNVPVGTTLTVTVVGFMGASTSVTSTALAGTLASSTATASVTVPTYEPAVVSAAATFTIASLDGQGPYYAEGEPVDRVRVTAQPGGESLLAFVTRSGREVAVFAR